MAKNIGISVVVDARDATNAFKDLERGFKKSHRAANEFGNILGGLSSELGGFGKAFGALGAALASGSIWGAAAAGLMLLVDTLKEARAGSKELAKKFEGELTAGVKVFEDAVKAADERLSKLLGRDPVKEAMERTLKANQWMLAQLQEQKNEAAAEGTGEATLGATGFEASLGRAFPAEKQKQINDLTRAIARQRTALEDYTKTTKQAAGIEAAKKQKEINKKSWDDYQAMLFKEALAEDKALKEHEAKEKDAANKDIETWFKAAQKEVDDERKLKEALDKYDADRLNEKISDVRTLGAGLGDIFASLGTAFEGSAGQISAMLGKLIQQAIQLAIAMSATGGPFAWLNIAAAAAAIFATVASIPKFEAGTPYVPKTGLAMVHEGERIIPAWENRGGAGGMVVNVNALDGADVERTLVRNQRAVLRLQERMARNRRRA